MTVPVCHGCGKPLETVTIVQEVFGKKYWRAEWNEDHREWFKDKVIEDRTDDQESRCCDNCGEWVGDDDIEGAYEED